jgi:hypothetical protein
MATLRDVSEMAGWVRGLGDKIERGAAKGVIAITHEAERTAKLMTKQQFTGRGGRRKSGNLMNAIKSQFALPTSTAKGRPLLQGFVVVRGQKGDEGTKPYGRAHEFGAEIKPKKAKWLWLKNYEGDAAAFKDMTPTDFISNLRRNPGQFKLIYPDPKKNHQKIPIAWWFGELKAKVKANRTTKPRRKASIGATLKRSLRKSLGIGGKGSGKKRGARKTTKETGPRWVPLFFLRKHVTIPERPFVRPAIAASVGPNGRRFWAVLQRFIRQE